MIEENIMSKRSTYSSSHEALDSIDEEKHSPSNHSFRKYQYNKNTIYIHHILEILINLTIIF